MPKIKVDINATKNYRTETLHLSIKRITNNQRQDLITTIQHVDSFPDIESVAEWILQQESSQIEPSHDISKRLIIDFHTEEDVDEDGQPITIRVLDNVDTQLLPEDKAKNQFGQLPVFGNGLSGIDTWVDETITNLPTAKQAIADIAKACFFLQVQLNGGGN